MLKAYYDSMPNDKSQNNLVPNNARLNSWKMGLSEYQKIVDYVGRMVMSDGNEIIKRKLTKLPFSLACSSKNGSLLTVILFKNHNIDPLGIGAFNKVTLAYNMQNGCELAFRSCALKYLGRFEVEMNKKFAKYPDLFVAAEDFFFYEGPCAARTPWEPRENIKFLDDNPLSTEPKQQVEKAGALLELGKCSLHGLLKEFLIDNHVKMYIALCIAKSLKVMHDELKIVHTDIKTQNIIITKDGIAKITDFGLARDHGHLRRTDEIRYYTSPENINGALSERCFYLYNSSDMWSYGILLLEMFNVYAFERWHNFAERLRKNEITLGEFNILIWSFLNSLNHDFFEPKELRPLIKQCLTLKSSERATAADMITGIEDILKNIAERQNKNILEEHNHVTLESLNTQLRTQLCEVFTEKK